MRVLHLRGGVGEYIRVGIGRRARHIAGMAEQIGRAPQQLDAGRQHPLLEIFGHLLEIAREIGERRALGDDVAVMEGEKGDAEQRKHLEGDVGLLAGRGHRVGEPRALESRDAEHVGAGPGEIVPVADRRPQMLGDGLAHDDPRRVIMAIGERILAGRAFVGNRRDIAEKSGPHCLLLLAPPRAA